MSREVPPSMGAGWRSPVKIGPFKPTVRATIQRHELKRFDYDTAWSQGGTFEVDRHRTGQFTSMIFGDESSLREIPNIINCEWDRSVGQDAATCTLTLLNTEETPLGELGGEDFDQPGHYTYSRGQESLESNPWGYGDTGWQGVFVPDMMVKTYEGYGSNPAVSPAQDEHLMPSGVWLIDKVTYGVDGSITLEMRDLARMLLDQIVFPPAVPFAEYPLIWSGYSSQMVPSRDAIGGSWLGELYTKGTARSSNELYVGEGFTNEPYPEYVRAGGVVEGHAPIHVIVTHPDWGDGDPESDNLFWRSTGQDSQDAWAWWEFEADTPIPIAAIKMRLSGGPYRAYISVHNGDKWIGTKDIPYRLNGVSGSPGNFDIEADIPFVRTLIADRFWPFETTLPRKYNAKKIRITFTRMHQHTIGEHPFRVGLREMKVYTAGNIDALSFERGERLKVVGNYGDYSHIVKWVCAWGGFYWPPHSTGLDFLKKEVGTSSKDFITYNVPDPAIPTGRVWGDFMRAGTSGEADLGVEMFDKKPLMDIINYVRDLLGFLFFIDETGGVVWRMPNMWELGNYQSPGTVGGVPAKRGRFGRTSEILTLDENETLLEYETTLDSSNLRERIFVANNVGGFGTVIKGYNPFPVGFRRTAGYSDQHFKNKRETRVMAEMIAARQMYGYRQGTAVIPGFPGIQVDDQVRIVERVTNETYYHYVLGIKSSLDMESGEWTYSLQTHWLGEDPTDLWVLPSEELTAQTKAYLAAIGYGPVNDEDNDDSL